MDARVRTDRVDARVRTDRVDARVRTDRVNARVRTDRVDHCFTEVPIFSNPGCSLWWDQLGLLNRSRTSSPTSKFGSRTPSSKLCLGDPMILYRACWALANGGTPALSALKYMGGQSRVHSPPGLNLGEVCGFSAPLPPDNFCDAAAGSPER